MTRCVGETATLDAGVAAASYLWTNVNTGEELSTTQSIEVTQDGFYKLEVTNAACNSSVVTEVRFSPLPTVSFDVLASSPCSGQAIDFVNYTFSSLGGVSSTSWDFGDGTSSASPGNFQKTFANAGVFQVLLTAQTEYGCEASFIREVEVKETPVADFAVVNACVELPIAVTNNSPADADSYWNFGDETTSQERQPVKSFAYDGLYSMKLVATRNGCSSEVIKQVEIYAAPTLNFGDAIRTCGNSIVLDALNTGSTYRWYDPLSGVTISSDAQLQVDANQLIGLEVTTPQGCVKSDEAEVLLGVPIEVNLGQDRRACERLDLSAGYFPGAQFVWSNGFTEQINPISVSGTYTVEVVDQNGCAGQDGVTITIDESPTQVLPPLTSLCEGSTATLTGGASNYEYNWSTGETTSYIDVGTAGQFNVLITNGSCQTTSGTTVVLESTPVASFEAVNACAGDDITFVNNSTIEGGGIFTSLWDFGDGTMTTIEDPVKRFSNGGIHNVALTVSSGGCQAIVSKDIRSFFVPATTFDVSDGCTGSALALANTTSYGGSANLSYEWSFGDGTTSTVQDPAKVYTAAGIYWISLQVTSDEGCSRSFTKKTVIGSTPDLTSWQSEVHTCNPGIALDAGNAGSAFGWSTGAITQTIEVNNGGLYSVLITSPDGCSAFASTNVVFNQQLNPNLPESIEGCGVVKLDPQVQAATYLWSTGAQTRTIDVSLSDIYSVQVISEDLCIAIDESDVLINPVPVFELGPDLERCDGEVLTLQADAATPAERLWSTGQSLDAIQVSTTGLYKAKLTTSKGCVYQDSIRITFNPLPVMNFNDQMTACGPLMLDAGNPGSTYSWSTGETTRRISLQQSGVVQLHVTSAKNCHAAMSTSVTINPLPVVNLGDDATLCHGDSRVLDAGTSGDTYRWSDETTKRFLDVGSTGTYSVTVTNEYNCQSSDAIRVTVRPSLGLDLGADRLLCNDEGFNLSANVNNVTYEWGSVSGFQSNQKAVDITSSGLYWLRITDALGCTAIDSVQVTPTTETITASFLVPSVVNVGDRVQFAHLTEPPPKSLYWRFGDGGFSSKDNPIHTYYSVGNFTVSLAVSNGVCSDTLEKVVVVRQGRELADPVPLLPSFTDFVRAQLYPNPAKGAFKVAVSLTSEAEVLVSVFSLNGILLAEERKKMLDDEFGFDLSDQTDAVYVVRIIASGKLKVLKIFRAGSSQY